MDHGSQEVSWPLLLLLIVTVRSAQCSQGKPSPATIHVCQVQPVAKSGVKSWKEWPPPTPPPPQKKNPNVGGAGLHWAHSVWASRSKRKMGVGELNERLFIRELNAAEYFLSAVKRLNICHWKALSAHAKMKSTAASLCGSVLADKKNVAGRTFPMSRAVNWLDFPPGSLHTWWVRAASETCSLRRVSIAMHKFPYIALTRACLYIHLLQCNGVLFLWMIPRSSQSLSLTAKC